jgi:hypothetical protein
VTHPTDPSRTRLLRYRRAALAAVGLLCTCAVTMSPSGALAASGERAYEQVSPQQKGGTPVVRGTTWPFLTLESGDAIVYRVNGALPGAAASLQESSYIARRTGSAWTSEPVDAPQQNSAFPNVRTSVVFTPDMAATLQFSELPLAPGAITGGFNGYRRDNATGERTTYMTYSGPWLPQLIGDLVPADVRQQASLSADARHAAITTGAPLTPDAVPGTINAFELRDDGPPRLINRLPDGSVGTNGGTGAAAVSPDGRRIVFASPASNGPTPLYMRIDGATTVPISASQIPGDPDTAQPAKLMGISTDFSTITFSSFDRLTVDAQTAPRDADYAFIYQYNTLTSVVTLVVPEALLVHSSGVALVSQAGDAIYFDTGGILGERYIVRGGEVRYLGPQRDGFKFFSASGRYLIFDGVGSRTGQPASSGACEGECSEILRYDTVTQETICVSCRDSGDGNRDSGLRVIGLAGELGPPTRQVLDDGRVYFVTAEGLVSQDTNGRDDVYESDGSSIRLISPGTGPHDAYFQNASADGRDVFFTTTEQVLRQDKDSERDLYDARVGGGIASQNEDPTAIVTCDGDACQDPPAPGPPASAVATFTAGAGNSVKAPVRAPRATLKVTARRIGPGSRIVVHATTTARGQLTISGAAARAVRSGLVGAGTRDYTVTLTGKASRRLKQRRRLSVRLNVRLTPTVGAAISKSVTLTLKAR